MTSATDHPSDLDLLIREVGPREGFQIEKTHVPTGKKVELIESLASAGLRDIQVTSFVSPKAVPQMADAEELVKLLPVIPYVRYSATILNKRGLERALATGLIAIDPRLACSASEVFAMKNVRRTTEEQIAAFPEMIEMYHEMGVSSLAVDINAVFGCNWSGPVAHAHVRRLIERLYEIAETEGFSIREISIADTMGWANPQSVTDLMGQLRSNHPDVPLRIHLHDTRGMGIVNAYAAIEAGVTCFDASIGGLGGCPFGGGASGNIATEDLVHMCDHLGLRTGINCAHLLESVQLAEKIVKHPLPGKLLRGGILSEDGVARTMAED